MRTSPNRTRAPCRWIPRSDCLCFDNDAAHDGNSAPRLNGPLAIRHPSTPGLAAAACAPVDICKTDRWMELLLSWGKCATVLYIAIFQ